MCKFIKDNGEQCGRDADPFCFQHDDTEQAEQWRNEKKSEYGSVSDAVNDAVSDPTVIEMDTTCDDCGSALRRTERLTSPDTRPHHVLFEAVVECDCGEHVLGAQAVRKAEIKEAWQ